MIDVVHSIGKKGFRVRAADTAVSRRKLNISVLPAVGYSLSTSLAAIVAGNATFNTGAGSSQSSISSSVTYTANHQVIFPLQSQLYFGQDKYILNTDWRYLKYPSLSFGLGARTTLDEGYTLDYSALRLHQSVLRRIDKNVYLGIGWDFDYFWNIHELDTPSGQTFTDFTRYGARTTESANGPVLSFQWDTRGNILNPQGGGLLKIDAHLHPKELGNEQNWRALTIDARKYFRLPASSQNVLAFWNYDWITNHGKVPYLLLPNTGGDPSSNTGRGYIQGRYRGANFIYAEGEYRFRILNNGLLGGVVFGNAESVSRYLGRGFSTIAPGYGAGIRIKVNKFSGANIAIDYGFGNDGSKGVFVNLGEVF